MKLYSRRVSEIYNCN